MADWTFVCNTSDVDFEDQYRFDHNDRTYCIYHLEDGFYATDGLCTHEDIHLVDGLIDGEEIECPMHLGVFNICLLYTSPSPRDQRGSRMPACA